MALRASSLGASAIIPIGGPAGVQGLSAYQVWLASGNVGTIATYLASLQGAPGAASTVPGPKGDTGGQGDSAYKVWLALGNSGAPADFLAALKGTKGDSGRGYVSATVDANFNLQITASDGTTVNAGYVRGPQGAGVAIKGSVASPGALPASGAGLGDTYIMTASGSGYASGDGYVYTGAGNDAGPGGNWHNVGQIRGPAGAQGNPTTVNNKTGSSITLAAADVGAVALAADGSANLSKLALTSTGSTGDVSGMSVTSSTTTKALSDVLASVLSNVTAIANEAARAAGAEAALAPKASPTFTGSVTAPKLALSGAGSTGDVSAMSVTPTGAASAAALADHLAGLVNKTLRLLPDRSTFAPSNVAGAGEYSMANSQIIVPAGLVVKGTGWDGAAFIIHEGNDCDTRNSGQNSSKVNGFTVVHALDQALPSGSAGKIRGGRQAGNFVLVKAVQTSADNPDRHYVGLVGQALDKTGDGGTSATPLGRVFGFNAYGGVQTNSFWENLTSGEHNTEYDPTATVDYHSGLAIVGILGKRGRTLDTGLAIGAIGPSFAFVSGTANTRGFGNGITFTNKNGRSPVESDSVLMTFDHTATVLRAFDFASVNFGAEIIRTPNMGLAENFLNLGATNASLSLGLTTSASAPRLNFASGGAGSGIYDSSIIATGGTVGTAGRGALTVQAATWSFGTAAVLVGLSSDPTNYPAGRLYRDANGFVKVVF